MAGQPFSWKDPRFTLADALTGARLIMLPYLIYALVRPLPGMAVATLAVMIGTDLVDGRIARRLGQARDFGAVFDSTVDFVLIYSVFTTLFVIDVLPWWKWAVIFFPGLLMLWVNLLQVQRAGHITLAPVPAGKVVGQLQFVYLPLLLARAFWLSTGWAQTVDHGLFGVLAVAIVVNTIDYGRSLRRLLATPPGRAPAARS